MNNMLLPQIEILINNVEKKFSRGKEVIALEKTASEIFR
jgi:hypothetical protein